MTGTSTFYYDTYVSDLAGEPLLDLEGDLERERLLDLDGDLEGERLRDLDLDLHEMKAVLALDTKEIIHLQHSKQPGCKAPHTNLTEPLSEPLAWFRPSSSEPLPRLLPE